MSDIQKLVLRDRDFYRRAIGITLPIAAQQLITTGVNMMDTIMVTSVGELQLSGVSLANQFIVLFSITCMGIGMGASVLISRYYGMKDEADLKRSVVIMIRFALGVALAFSIVTALAPKWIMRIYTNETDVITHGVNYLRFSVPTYVFLGLSTTCAIALRCVDHVRVPLYSSIGAFGINLLANYTFIYGKFGAPRMEEAGAALGTLLSRIFETAVICGYLFFRDRNIRLRFRDLFMKTRVLLGEYFRISIPVLISDGIYALGNNSVSMVIGRLGASMVAANAITGVVQQLTSVLTQGMAQAGAILTGQVLGEGDRQKAEDRGFAFLGLGILFGTMTAVVILLIDSPMIRAYHVSEATSAIASELMASISIIIVFQAINSIMTKGVLRGGGDTKILMVADNIFLWILALPLGLLAGFVLHLPAFWIYFFLKSDQIAKAIWCVFRLKSGKWIHVIQKAED